MSAIIRIPDELAIDYDNLGWDFDLSVLGPSGEPGMVFAYGETWPLASPLSIHLGAYRKLDDADLRFAAMKAAHDLLWPKRVATWHYWTERVFRAHCNRENKIIVLAGGGGIGKTDMAAMMSSIFFLANPYERLVLAASTTLDSVQSRIFGYVLAALRDCVVDTGWQYQRAKPPKIHPPVIDDLHGIFAIAAAPNGRTASEDDDAAIKNWIGRHPKDALMVVLDESTDLPVAILKAKANLERGIPGGAQIISIGNSIDKNDLHGLLATPSDEEGGWAGVGIERISWKTSQPGGICFYFNPHESPAIHETDAAKKKLLSGFLIDEKKLEEAARDMGTDNPDYWRFVMGFWRSESSVLSGVMSAQLMEEYQPGKMVEWGGMVPLRWCAGIDPSFSAGGDKCILQLGRVGVTADGVQAIDLRGDAEGYSYVLRISVGMGVSPEIQIADQVIQIMWRRGIPLSVLCVDGSGQGRGIAEIIQLRGAEFVRQRMEDMRMGRGVGVGIGGMLVDGFASAPPTKIMSHGGNGSSVGVVDYLYNTSAYDVWDTLRGFIGHRQVFGLGLEAIAQVRERLVEVKSNGRKVLESKLAFKKRMAAKNPLLAHSPDEADSSALCVLSGKMFAGLVLGGTGPKRVIMSAYDKAWKEIRDKGMAELAARRAEEERKMMESLGRDRAWQPKAGYGGRGGSQNSVGLNLRPFRRW